MQRQAPDVSTQFVSCIGKEQNNSCMQTQTIETKQINISNNPYVVILAKQMDCNPIYNLATQCVQELKVL